MKTFLISCFGLALFLAAPAYAQHSGEAPHEATPAAHPPANGGHPPAAPEARKDNHAKPEVEHGPGGKPDKTQHVNNDHWYGHASPNDKRYHFDKPFEHGHFEKFGASYHYSVARVDAGAHRFWLPGGFYFEVASWEWATCADWCWNCGDEFVIYEDPDHPGWYLVYDLQTGQYVHAEYLGT